jgi:carotenoid cleavage dioxygenase-like enzyme
MGMGCGRIAGAPSDVLQHSEITVVDHNQLNSSKQLVERTLNVLNTKSKEIRSKIDHLPNLIIIHDMRILKGYIIFHSRYK